MVNDPELKKKLSNFTVNDNRTHVTQLPSFCKPTVHFDMTQNDTDDERPDLTDCSDSGRGQTDVQTEEEVEADYFTGLVTPKKLNSRSRAAPFYNELAPGWRARAKFLAPPFSRNASLQPRQMVEPKDLAEDDVSGLGNGDDENSDRFITHRKGEAGETSREKEEFTLVDEQGRTRRKGKDRFGNDRS